MPNESSTLFSDLLGNEELKKTLQRLVEKKALPRVLLFHGPKGVGKCQFALQLAKQLTGSTISVDLQTLTPEGKNDVYSAERVRLLLEHAQPPPPMAKQKPLFSMMRTRCFPQVAMHSLKCSKSRLSIPIFSY